MNMEMPKKLFQMPTKMYFTRFIEVPPSKLGKIVVHERDFKVRAFKWNEKRSCHLLSVRQKITC
jgi:hypothetical protein